MTLANDQLIQSGCDSKTQHTNDLALVRRRTTKEEASKLSKIARKMTVANYQTIFQDSDIQEMFASIDLNGDGEVTFDEVKNAAERGKLGLIYSEESCSELMASIDTDGNGLLSFEEFREYIRGRERVLLGLFEQLDLDDNGSITAEEIVEFSTRVFGFQISENEAQGIISTLDTDNSGSVEIGELVKNAILSVGDTKHIFKDLNDAQIQQLTKISRKMASAHLDSTLSDSEISKLFQSIDVNGDGEVNAHEIAEAARNGKLGFIHSVESCREFLSDCDRDGNGTLSYEEFRRYIRLRERVLFELFEQMDKEKHGYITAEEISEYAHKVLGLDLPLTRAEEIVHEFESHDGRLAYDHFLKRSILTVGDAHETFHSWVHHRHFFLCDDELSPPPIARTVFASFVAGAVSRTITAPLDRAAAIMRAGIGAGGWPSTLRALVKKGGLKSLWIGNGINSLTVGPEVALHCYLYFWLKPHVFHDELNPALLEKFIAAGFAGFLAMSVVYPLHVIKDRITLDTQQRFKNLPDFIRQSYKKEGKVSFYRGYGAFSLRTFPYRGLNIVGYSFLHHLFWDSKHDPTIAQSMMLGAASSGISEILTAPLNTARIKMIWQGPVLGQPFLYNGFRDCLQKVYAGDTALGLKPQGWSGIFRGLSANMIKTCPSVAIQFAVFDIVVNAFPEEIWTNEEHLVFSIE